MGEKMECKVLENGVLCEEETPFVLKTQKLFRDGFDVCVQFGEYTSLRGNDEVFTMCTDDDEAIELFERFLRQCEKASEEGDQTLLNKIAEDAINTIKKFVKGEEELIEDILEKFDEEEIRLSFPEPSVNGGIFVYGKRGVYRIGEQQSYGGVDYIWYSKEPELVEAYEENMVNP